MFKKSFFTILLVLFLLGTVFADIGPSPSYTFSISNASVYPTYSFFYAGNIWKDKLTPVTGTTSVYKFNTAIKIYAVESGRVMDLSGNKIDINTFAGAMLSSNVISLGGGNNVLKIDSFDETNKTMVVSVETFSPDPTYPLQVLLFDPIGWIFLLVILCIFGAGVVFVYKKFRKSK